MKIIQKIETELAIFESRFADDILALSAELARLPQDRDPDKLGMLLRALMSSRRKLSMYLKSGLRTLDIESADGQVPARKMRALRKVLNSSKHLLRHWGRFETIILAQINAAPSALLKEQETPRHEDRVMDHVIEMFLAAMHKVANPTSDDQEDEASTYGCHRDIPLPMTSFSQMIGAAHRICLALQKEHPLRFLDVGSGGGTKVLAATTCFEHCDGLEYEKSTVETGTQLLKILGVGACRLMHGDALQFDDYGAYDVIYFYRPMANFERLVEMEDRIISQARPGTVIISAGGLNATELAQKDVHEVVHNVYVSGLTEEDAVALHSTAELMGPMVPGYGRRNYRVGYWAPLYDVSARNGYFI